VGGCTLEAAEAVCGKTKMMDEGQQAAELSEAARAAGSSSVLDGLAALVDKSLLRQEEQEDGEPRFFMLETIRDFALEKLEEDTSSNGREANDIRELHAKYYLVLSERAEPHLAGPDQLVWANRVEAEHDNLRAALSETVLNSVLRMQNEASKRGRSAIAHSAWVGLRLAGTIWPFWAMRGYLAEGRRWLRLALDAVEKVQEYDEQTLRRAGIEVQTLSAAHLKVLNGIGVLARLAGDFPAAGQALESGLTIARETGDQSAVAKTLNNLGAMAMIRGDYGDARRFLEEGLTIRRKLGLELDVGHSLTQLGNVAMTEGNYAEARRLHSEGLAIKRRAGDKQGIGQALHSLATIALREGDYSEARRLDEETLAIARDLGNRQGMAYSLRDLGKLACEQGDYARAHAAFLESLALFQELENLMPIIECVIGIARVTDRTGQPDAAARLLGAANAMLESTEGKLDPPDHAAYGRDLMGLRTQLGAEVFTAAWNEGKSLSLEEVQTLALGDTTATAPAPTTPARNVSEPGTVPPPRSGRLLTTREIEVLQLVAAGLTNPGIAEHLHLSMGTVQTHMSSIFSKINVNTRAAAVRYAFEHSLV
jgi:DNA-binding CsgD family transcriptional regulator/tetratricopeptide (TPR) repeat protein